MVGRADADIQKGQDIIADHYGGTLANSPSRAVAPEGNEIMPAQHRLGSAISFLWPRGKA